MIFWLVVLILIWVEMTINIEKVQRAIYLSYSSDL